MEPDLKVDTTGRKTHYRPGEEIEGELSWYCDPAPEAWELRLFWYTSGKGTQDIGLVESLRFDHPGPEGRQSYRMQLPLEPYSFSGKLISLTWALELVDSSDKHARRFEFVMAPQGEEVNLLNS